jgi:diaminohydroxyphosphoribosylaminopyrimidine deaminase / 5-amino-6-(5-phosphoribosylamino)uracil reductase
MHEFFMKMALDLAIKAKGRTSPNPMVGALVVNEGAVVGTGYHKKAGTRHAEVEAITAASGKTSNATLYVTLEPCCHYGKTGPCTDLIISSGIRKVVFAMEDPNPLVAGKGKEQLKKAGIEVVSEVLLQDAMRLNEVYIKSITSHMPFVVLKSALSLDGKVATSTGQSQWISGKEARTYAHQLRDTYDAVLVGVDTIISDDPQLNVRIPDYQGRNPVRIVLDSTLRIPLTSRVIHSISQAETIIATTAQADKDKFDKLASKGIKIYDTGSGTQVNIAILLKKLLKENHITSILVEGGPRVSASFLSEGLVDKICWFIAPIMIGGHEAKGPLASIGISDLSRAPYFKISYVQQLGNDLFVEAYPEKVNEKLCLQE